MGLGRKGSESLRHSKPNPPNMRRRRYGKWLDRAAELLRVSGESRTANWLIENLPDDRHSPPNANSAAQKLKKDKRFGSFMGNTQDLHHSNYKTNFFFYEYEGGNDEE